MIEGSHVEARAVDMWEHIRSRFLVLYPPPSGQQAFPADDVVAGDAVREEVEA